MDDDLQRPARRDWTEQAEEDFAAIVPRGFFPWWGNVAFGVLLTSALHFCDPPALPLPVSVGVAAVVGALGARTRRGPVPTVARAWTAAILAIAAFLAVLAVFVDDDTLLPTVLWSFTAAGLAYLTVMAARRETLGPGRSHRN